MVRKVLETPLTAPSRLRSSTKERAVIDADAKLKNELNILLKDEPQEVRQYVMDAIPLRAPRFWVAPEQILLLQLARTSVLIDTLQKQLAEAAINGDTKAMSVIDSVLKTNMSSVVKLRNHLGLNRVSLFSTNPNQMRAENITAAQVLEIAEEIYDTDGNAAVDNKWLYAS
jgi:hypothetical protein